MNYVENRAMPNPRRFGVVGTLLLAVMLVVAACGGATDPTQTPSSVAPTATTMTTAPTATTASANPTATTASDDATEMPMDMETMTADATETMPMDMDMSTPTAGTAAEAPTTAAAAETPTTAASGSESGSTEVSATLREWALDLSVTEVSAGAVRFVVTNEGRFAHNFAIRDSSGNQLEQTPNFTSGDGEQVVEVTLQPGTYTVYCALPGHEQQGQVNTIVVN